MIKACLKAIFIHQEGVDCSAVQGATDILHPSLLPGGFFGSDLYMFDIIK